MEAKATSLESYYEPLLSQLHDACADDRRPHFRLDKINLPLPPKTFASSELRARAGKHIYGDPGEYIADKVVLVGERATFGAIGLLILAAAFHRCDQITVPMTHPKSELKRLHVCYGRHFAPGCYGLDADLIGFDYEPSEVPRHPCSGIGSGNWDLPEMRFADFVGQHGGEGAYEGITGFGSHGGALRLAKILIDCSRLQNEQLEFDFECAAGYHAIGHASIEFTFGLPGSFYWS